MKIIRLQAENIKKLRAIDITPESNVVKITGKNAQGKTSVLDSILYAIAGKKYIPSKPIREGEKKANIEIDLGDFKINRSFTEAGTYLKVTTKEGAQYPKAQEKLSKFIKNISFDPLEFANKSSKEQVETLTELLGISEKLEELEEAYERAYEERTITNRALREAEAKLNIDKPKEKYFGVKRIDVSKVSDQLEKEREKLIIIQQAKDTINECKSEIESLEEGLKEAKLEMKTAIEELAHHKKDFDEKIVDKLKEKLKNATEINERISEAQTFTRLQTEAETLKRKAENWDNTVKEVIAGKMKLITKSNMPIEGLNINENREVTYNNIPFDQLSGAERLKVSLSIAMAMNPELRVIRILDGSLLDEDNLKVIEEMATDKDYQVWLEQVRNDGEVGFYIEDGSISKIDGVAIEDGEVKP